ncbi:response regulator [Sphingobium phenoxybenzoativorans]|uniref:histidine kinase n=1 Tax=Sphingobium phenoxybenzoativorans TaxID=1592790 RepID=A0A975KB04_9SPHN|nr:response regulator [Sphingobium phenoxybenzoativorans]QUT06667.1 response regulator [Sphingobium phenoxybenzoativorans]
MGNFFNGFLQALPPHGYCLLWWPQLVWTHVISDALIALAYFSIPLALIQFVRRRKDMEFGGIFWLFALFITACGATHVMSIWNLWHGDYGIEALIKVVTAIASIFTAILLWPLLPKLLAMPSPGELTLANRELGARIAERDDALAALKHEVAERRKAEAALLQAQKIEAIGQLTGGIAHDFNNLLQTVSGNMELILNNVQDNPRVSRWAVNAASALDRGKKLTAQLLAFSRTQALELKPIALRPAITDTIDMLHRTLGPQVTLEPDLGAGYWHVIADPTQLELSILNLAINARDAMPGGGILRIMTKPVLIMGDDGDLPPGQYIDIIVSDSGTGMPAEVRDRAFEPFFTTKDQGRGTGLGLSMVFGIARQSGGTVILDSEVGRGTTVTIRLRRAEVADAIDAPGSGGQEFEDQVERLDGIHALLVDDDDEVRTTLLDVLTSLGAQVTEASSGAQAIDLLQTVEPDVAILDFAMPGMTGAETAARISLIQPDLPIVIASGYADTQALRIALGERIAMLHKPFRHHELTSVIRAVLMPESR